MQEKTQEKLKDQPKPIIDRRPYLCSIDRKIMDEFVLNFEDEVTQNRYNHYSIIHLDEREETELYERILDEMLTCKEPIPIESSYDFREALLKAYNYYNALKIAEFLPIAHEQYLLNKKMGFIIGSKRKLPKDINGLYTKMILGGRELNGEPRDFNF
jgi:hypothetical protein